MHKGIKRVGQEFYQINKLTHKLEHYLCGHGLLMYEDTSFYGSILEDMYEAWGADDEEGVNLRYFRVFQSIKERIHYIYNFHVKASSKGSIYCDYWDCTAEALTDFVNRHKDKRRICNISVDYRPIQTKMTHDQLSWLVLHNIFDRQILNFMGIPLPGLSNGMPSCAMKFTEVNYE